MFSSSDSSCVAIGGRLSSGNTFRRASAALSRWVAREGFARGTLTQNTVTTMGITMTEASRDSSPKPRDRSIFSSTWTVIGPSSGTGWGSGIAKAMTCALDDPGTGSVSVWPSRRCFVVL